ncbi:hypothetical protein E0H73_39670 [Kribbella pittospori]|uniref:Peptidase M4 C-terminal domain-containing protein n=1 Tax=Kribbella pittospori TaxID=722689 RepID=A0A4R0K4L9_9ACTN|nr:hypothetical protein [Kribbella pittospori]TCC54270.1 hypothetical protein E0H73_39670 [Kribbella pittospori]
MADPLAKVQLLIQDGAVSLDDATGHGIELGSENKVLRIAEFHNDRFVDGPACRRVAVVDFDPKTGLPLPAAARFVPSKPGSTLGAFPYDGDPTSASTIAVNAFGIVFQTIRMFEGPEALGRQVSWAFGSDQLLIVPRAGEWENSYYERATRSLQFFFFLSAANKTIYLALSRDIVAHECGHALLDAVVPSLYDSSTPQSLAIHEAVADQIAVLMALDSGTLRTDVLKRSDNSLDGSNAFSSIAEEFGRSTPGPGGIARTALRDLANSATLPDLAGTGPHELSTLLSGIFYDTLRSIFATRYTTELNKSDKTGTKRVRDRAANKALGTAHIMFRRLLLRGIDYLPPGELTFADVGRAIIAADVAAYADGKTGAAERERLAERFVTRLVVRGVKDLDTTRPPELDVATDRLDELKDSDWAAYGYVETHRELLGIPPDASFTVLPRVDSTKVTGPIANGKRPTQRELILKVAWNVGGSKRPMPAGATVSLRWDDGRCLALVASEVALKTRHEGHDDG